MSWPSASRLTDTPNMSKENLNVTSHQRTLGMICGLLAAAFLFFALVGSASAAGPLLRIEVSSAPTVFAPGSNGGTNESGGVPEYVVLLRNVGSEDVTLPYTITDILPPGVVDANTGLQTVTLTPADLVGKNGTDGSKIQAGYTASGRIPVEVNLSEGAVVTDRITVSGGGSPDAEDTTTTTISSTPAPFGIVSTDLNITDPDGSPVTQASSHPDQVTIGLTLPAVDTGAIEGRGLLVGAEGGVRDLTIALPHGLIVDPLATPIRCTEAQLEGTGEIAQSEESCPVASQVGLIDPTTSLAGDNFVGPAMSPLYNMVPPPGVPAEFGFDLEGLQVFLHVEGGVRSGDYTLTAQSRGVLSKRGQPVLGVRTVLWGDPSAEKYDHLRGPCVEKQFFEGTCTTARQSVPLLTTPSSCQSAPTAEFSVDSWGAPERVFRQDAVATDLNGDPTAVTGCNALEFRPGLTARPTTNLADSSSGLGVDLTVPQRNELGTLATPTLRRAEVTLPEGLVVNPSAANGLGDCSSAQIGVDASTGVADGSQPACPSSSRIGTVELETPLLDHVLPGSVYLATPGDNPFHSLLAVYVVVEDPASGVLIKLPGHVLPDPQTGRLTAVFDNNPQLPFSDLKVNFKSGAQGVLRTPAACGKYATTAALTPWSAPESGPPASPSDSFEVTQSPAGGCASSSAGLSSARSFEAGTTNPAAGKYSPFVLNLKREDGTQQFSRLTLSLPQGLLARLAGTSPCSDTALALAAGRSGTEESQSPSCPADSQIGSVEVGAGAGPSPYYTKGKVYLAGPYKSAPLSLAIVTPATAGPFDLGTVVVRAAIEIDPETTKITAVSDPIPQILQGIPLDIRQIRMTIDRPGFTLNPTSCDPMSAGGQVFSPSGGASQLESRFQVGGCSALAFKPRLSLRLKGKVRRTAHPRLIATVRAREGDANIARAQVKLPHAAFLDQGHIKTVCTRVQWAADTCPAGSIYGSVEATTPLLSYPLTGSVYLRSSSHKLPDLVAKLKGPASQPIEIDLDGKTDSVKGALRNTFEAVPDAPVSTFRLELFGGKRGLIEMSNGFCSNRRATVDLDGQNGKVYDTQPVVQAKCPKPKKVSHGHGHAKKRGR